MVVLTLCKQTNKQTNEQKAKNDLSSLIALSLTPPSQKLLLVENASLPSILLGRLLPLLCKFELVFVFVFVFNNNRLFFDTKLRLGE